MIIIEYKGPAPQSRWGAGMAGYMLGELGGGVWGFLGAFFPYKGVDVQGLEGGVPAFEVQKKA